MTTDAKLGVGVRDGTAAVRDGQSLFQAIQAIGADSVELMVDPEYTVPYVVENGGRPFMLDTESNAKALKQRFDAEGIRIGALLLATDFSAEAADQHVDWAVRVTRAAQAMDVPAVRIDTATRNSSLPVPEIRDNFVRRVSQVLQQTSDTGVDLGIENHGHISNNPQFLDEVFAAVGDERLGMTLDTGNFYWFGFPLSELYKILEHFAPRAKHTHIKNINYPSDLVETRREIGYEYGKYAAPLDEGNIEMNRVVQVLRNAGYSRDLCIENEALSRYSPGEQVEILRRDVQALRKAL